MGSTRRAIGTALGLALVVTASTVAAPAIGASPAHAGGGDQGLAARLGADRAADVHIVRDPGTGTATFVGTRAGRPLDRPAGVDQHTPPATAARAFLTAHEALFGVAGPGLGIGAGRALSTPAAGHVVRFQQEQGGYPVLGGTVSVALTGDNEVASVAAHTTSPVPVESAPRVTAPEAQRTALEATARATHTTAAQLRVSQAPALAVFDPALLGVPTAARSGLVYKVEVGPRSAATPVRQLVLVDASRGSVLLNADELMRDGAEQQTVCTAGRRVAVTDPTCPPTGAAGQPTTVPDPTSGDADVEDAYNYADATFRFYRDVVGDTSALGLPTGVGDRALNSTVHLCDPSSTTSCVPMENAFWDGREMVYGDGFSSADDVVAHELTHSVTEHTSNLFYWYQSGAINESMSDVMGELVDQWDDPANDTDPERWVLGEDLPGTVGPTRNMMDPTKPPPGTVTDSAGVPVFWYPQPDKMTSLDYYQGGAYANATGAQGFDDDNGGVHINSGVGNKAAYLIVDGGIFNGVDVPGLGGAVPATRGAAITKAAIIYYLADEMLPSAANYAELYVVLPAACDQLVGGTAGVTTADCTTVRDAVKATEMNVQAPGATAPSARGCGSSVMSTDWYDDMEDPASGRWSPFSSRPARGPFYYPQNRNVYDNFPIVYATSGAQQIWGDDPDPDAYYNGTGKALPRDGVIAMTRAVRVPMGKAQYLGFNHAYQFEWYPATGGYSALFTDGGRVEYSVNGGVWQSAAKLFDVGGYNHRLTGFNALVTKQIYQFRGFGGDSHGYRSARLNLGSLAGKSVKFRFHVTADAAVGAMGWFIDDVRFYTCGSRPAAPYPVKETTGRGRVKVTWRPPADDGTSQISSYRVVVKAGRTVLRRATVGASVRSFALRVRRGKRVTSYLSAVNGAGAGPAGKSNTVRSR